MGSMKDEDIYDADFVDEKQQSLVLSSNVVVVDAEFIEPEETQAPEPSSPPEPKKPLEPYWVSDDGKCIIYHCSALEMLAELPDGAADLIITDPPYADETHKNARSHKNIRKKNALVTFKPVTVADIKQLFEEMARVSRRWTIATMEFRHAAAIELAPPARAKFIRMGVWVKPNGAPQFTGDRPGTGWEAIAFLHNKNARKKDKTEMKWNGGGRSSVFIHPIEATAKYPTQKPLGLIREFVELFSSEGDLVVDPCMGSGTTLVAAYERNRCVIGSDISEEACKLAVERIKAAYRVGSNMFDPVRLKVMKKPKKHQHQVKMFDDVVVEREEEKKSDDSADAADQESK